MIYENGNTTRLVLFNFITDPSGFSNYNTTFAIGGVRATLRRGHSYMKILRDWGEPNRCDTLTQW